MEKSIDPASYSYIIRVDRLRAGDVLLTRGADKDAFKIAVGTLGPYSHAAIWLPRAGSSPPYEQTWDLQLFESEDLGVGETPLLEAYVTTRDGHRFIGRLKPGALAIVLLRHPGIAEIDAARLGLAANRLRESNEHLGYSKLDRLAMAVDIHPLLRERLAAHLRSRDRRDITLVPGPFCSELVATYFQELGLPLFPEPREPEQVSPNHLAQCFLEEVSDAILDSSMVEKLEPIRQISLPRKEELPAWVRYRSRNINLKKQVDEMEAYFRLSRGETMNLQSRLLTQQAQEASKRVIEANQHGNIRMAQRLAVTATTQVLAVALIQEIQRRRETDTDNKCSSWSIAEARLVHLISKMLQSGGVALSRQTALLHLSAVRRFAHENRLTKTDSRVKDIRKAGVERWLRSREIDVVTRPLVEKTEETFFHDNNAAAIIDQVLQAAYESVAAN